MSRTGGRVLLVIGTRPEVIKLAPVHRALQARAPELEVRIALTGQHSALVDEALEVFGLRPHWDLELMREGQTLSEVAVGCLEGVGRVVREWPPDLLLVQGDTASVFFGALASWMHGVPVGHVEAGLRTGDLRRPFPEEGFRKLTGVLAELHFAPTERARENLRAEGVPEDRIEVTGNPVVDALLEVAGRALPPQDPVLRRLADPGAPPFILLTAHRRESFGPPLERVFQAVLEIVRRWPEGEVVFPVHPNPDVAAPAKRILAGEPRIHLVEPLAYPDLVFALRTARLVLTDSGGIQEEAPTFGTPLLVLREVSERPEGIEAGVATLVGTDPERIVQAAEACLHPSSSAEPDRAGVRPYGDGRAGERIAARVTDFLAGRGVGSAP